jgi:ketosteroid isomerase-like protein
MSKSAPVGNSEADTIRSVQRERSAALLAANIEAARRIHSDEFQLITPLGAVFSKDQYLSAVETGVLKYSVIELDSPVDVRVYGDVALIRYRVQIEIDVEGQRYPRTGYWFTDVYERRDGRWQIVWSQGTRITS